MTHPNLLLEDILDALVLEEAEPSYAALIRWSERYPEHRDALVEFFATWAVQAELPPETAIDEQRLASLAVSHALDIVHRQSETLTVAPKVSGAPARLIEAARAVGISEARLAARVGLDTTILKKLDLRRLTRIPRTCFERIATELGTVAERIQEMATGPPLKAIGVRHKAKRRPSLVTEDFADAIRNSSLPNDAKRFWLEAVAAERQGGHE
jgi:hypothetical protein